MTEQEWLNCDDPKVLIKEVEHQGSQRHALLFCCGCCRRVWQHLRSPLRQRAIEILEQFVDRRVDNLQVVLAQKQAKEDWQAVYSSIPDYSDDVHWDDHPPHVKSPLRAALKAADAVYYSTGGVDGINATQDSELAWNYCASFASMRGHDCVFDATNCGSRENHRRYVQLARAAWSAEKAVQVRILRDIVGPFLFRPTVIDNSWRTPDVIMLAQAIYDDRCLPEGTLDKTGLAIMADALEDAGCTNDDILNHCRSAGEHVRGCWVLDVVLAKE